MLLQSSVKKLAGGQGKRVKVEGVGSMGGGRTKGGIGVQRGGISTQMKSKNEIAGSATL